MSLWLHGVSRIACMFPTLISCFQIYPVLRGSAPTPWSLGHGWMKRFLPDALHSIPCIRQELKCLGHRTEIYWFCHFQISELPLKTSVIIITSLTGKATSKNEYRCFVSPYANTASCVTISFGFRVYLEMCQCRRERDFLRRCLCHSWYLPTSKE